MSNFLGWTDGQIENLVNDVYGGKVTREKLPKPLYNAILQRLTAALVEGFGSYEGGGAGAIGLFANLNKNLSVFSAAKTFQQVNDMSNFLFDSDGNKREIKEFKDAANQIFETYNDTWLETEFNTTLSQSQAARQWQEIQDDIDVFPLLKYSTVGDERVRNSHKDLDGIVAPVNDPFWATNYPPNDWNCRCIVEQLEDGDEPVTDLKKRNFKKPPELFQMNAGKDEIIFDEKKHPYLTVDQRYKVLKDKNFGL